MKRIHFGRVFLIAGLISLLIVYAVLWVRMITNSTERTGSDFISFYTAGMIAQNQGAAHVYDLELQRMVEQEQVGFALAPGQVLSFNHLPYLIPVLSVLVHGNYVASFARWAILMLIFGAISIGIMACYFRRKAFDTYSILIISAGALTFFPLFISLMNGQDTALLLLGACLWMLGLLMGQDVLTGLGLALMTVRPHIAVLLAFPLFFNKPKASGWFCLGAGVLAIFSFLILGVEGIRNFINILFLTARGEWYGMNESAMVNLIGLLLRFVPGGSTENVRMLGWLAYGLTLIGLCVLWGRSREIREKHIILTVVLVVFTVPHLHYHDLALLLVPLLALILMAVRDGLLQPREAGLAPLVVSLALLFGYLVPVLKYNLPYLVMAFIALAAWFPEKLIILKQGKDEILP